MPAVNADIIKHLKDQILSLQGSRLTNNIMPNDNGLGPINDSFPGKIFPFGAIHEFECDNIENTTATAGFIAGLLASQMQNGAVSLWISSSRKIFPPSLLSYGIDPDKIIFIDTRNEKDILWIMEEALKCEELATVVGEMRDLSFTASRRLQIVVEKSRVTGFVVRKTAYPLNTTACLTRWKIRSLSTILPDDMPGVGFPRWHVELLKVRNGKPGSWILEFKAGRFHPVSKQKFEFTEEKMKAG